MDSFQMLIFIATIFLAICTVYITFLTRNYVKSKPFGAQSTYDLLYCDVCHYLAAVIFILSFVIVTGLLFR